MAYVEIARQGGMANGLQVEAMKAMKRNVQKELPLLTSEEQNYFAKVMPASGYPVSPTDFLSEDFVKLKMGFAH